MDEQIELGNECFAYVNMVGDIQLVERGVDGFFTDVRFPPAQMDSLCKWWQARSGKRAYSIKPPVWEEQDGVYAMYTKHFSASVWQVAERWRAGICVAGVPRVEIAESMREARELCEARYREWVEQFLESA